MSDKVPCPNSGRCGSATHLSSSQAYQECLRASTQHGGSSSYKDSSSLKPTLGGESSGGFPLRSLIGDVSYPEEQFDCRIEWAGEPDSPSPEIVWNENMAFHFERNPELKELYEKDTPEFDRRVEEKLREILGSQWGAQVSREVDGEAQIMVWPLNRQFTPEMSEDEAVEKLQPAINDLINITDPGTFGSPYLFG